MFEQRINSQAAISINYSQQIINVPMDLIEAEIVERGISNLKH